MNKYIVSGLAILLSGCWQLQACKGMCGGRVARADLFVCECSGPLRSVSQ